MELNGRGVNVDIDNITIESRPSRRDILKAVSTIGRYIDDWNNPKYCLQVGSTFGIRHLHLDRTKCMQGTAITDFSGKYSFTIHIPIGSVVGIYVVKISDILAIF